MRVDAARGGADGGRGEGGGGNCEGGDYGGVGEGEVRGDEGYWGICGRGGGPKVPALAGGGVDGANDTGVVAEEGEAFGVIVWGRDDSVGDGVAAVAEEVEVAVEDEDRVRPASVENFGAG